MQKNWQNIEVSLNNKNDIKNLSNCFSLKSEQLLQFSGTLEGTTVLRMGFLFNVSYSFSQ